MSLPPSQNSEFIAVHIEPAAFVCRKSFVLCRMHYLFSGCCRFTRDGQAGGVRTLPFVCTASAGSADLFQSKPEGFPPVPYKTESLVVVEGRPCWSDCFGFGCISDGGA